MKKIRTKGRTDRDETVGVERVEVERHALIGRRLDPIGAVDTLRHVLNVQFQRHQHVPRSDDGTAVY